MTIINLNDIVFNNSFFDLIINLLDFSSLRHIKHLFENGEEYYIFQNIHIINNCKIYVYKVANNIIGFIAYIIESNVVIIKYISIKSEYRKCHIGTSLLRFIINEHYNCDCVSTISMNDDVLILFFIKNGFVLESIIENIFLHKKDNDKHGYVMKLNNANK